MGKRNYVWVVEKRTRNGRWVLWDVCDYLVKKKAADEYLVYWQRGYPKHKFRLRKYESTGDSNG